MDPIMFGDRYRADASIGIPGRTEAFSGEDTSTGTKVAVMTAQSGSDEDVSRWTTRAQEIAAAKHPDIAPVTDWGTQDDVFYAVQQWVEGADPKAMMAERGPLPSQTVARWGAQAAAALSAAHAREVVHGDVRMQNITVVQGEDVVLTGFGAPAVADAHTLPADAPPEAAYYMSPEQAGGKPAGNESDIYALGAVLYELSTGSVPFDGSTGVEVAALQQTAQAQAPRQVNPEVSASLENVITRAMQKDPAMRYASAEEMRADLERVAEGGAVAATQVMPAVADEKKSPWPWIIGITLAVLGALARAWWFGLIGGVPVPDVTGQTLAEATEALVAADLEVGEVTSEQDFPAEVEPGTVYRQNPEAGSNARSGSAVSLVLAGGDVAEVPDVVGLTEAEAISQLQGAGFEVAPVERVFDSNVEADTVIEQDPAAGTQVVVGSPVNLKVSKGTEKKAVPNVLGQTQAEATQTLKDAGFEAKSVDTPSSDVAEGNVIQQAPGAGVEAEVGSTVEIYVSSGPPPAEQVNVPNVVGKTQNAALQEIQAAGLIAQIENESGPAADAGKVSKQNPPPNTKVDQGSVVTITVIESSNSTSTP
jgi:beta-lactam-binding protein with PASTA domain